MNEPEKISQFWEDLKSGRFVSMVKETSKGESVNNSREVYNILKPLFAEQDDVEQAYFIFLNAKNRILSIEKLFSGSLIASTIYPREIVKRLIALKSCAFVMVHNHPSGSVEPSKEDVAVTIKIGMAATCIDAIFHDHIIIGDGYHSMADSGNLKDLLNEITFLMNLKPIQKIERDDGEKQKVHDY